MQALGSSPSSTTPGPHTRTHTHTQRKKNEYLKGATVQAGGSSSAGDKGKNEKGIEIGATTSRM